MERNHQSDSWVIQYTEIIFKVIITIEEITILPISKTWIQLRRAWFDAKKTWNEIRYIPRRCFLISYILYPISSFYLILKIFLFFISFGDEKFLISYKNNGLNGSKLIFLFKHQKNPFKTFYKKNIFYWFLKKINL